MIAPTRAAAAPPNGALVLGALLAVVIAAAACGGAVPTDFHHPSPAAARITVYRASVQVKSSAPTTRVSASCPAGAQMVGGGFLASDTFEYDAQVTAELS